MMGLVSVIVALVAVNGVLIYRMVREVRLADELERKLAAREAMAKDLYEENQHMLGILAGDRHTRRTAAAQARKMVGRA